MIRHQNNPSSTFLLCESIHAMSTSFKIKEKYDTPFRRKLFMEMGVKTVIEMTSAYIVLI
jgi:hypothetical protein